MVYPNIADRQKRYALRVFPCIPLLGADGTQIDNSMYISIDRPFVLLHAFVADQTDANDRESDYDFGITNALLYLENHPIINTALIADISAFHVSANQYPVNDLRPLENRNTKKQFVFALVCLDF